MDIQEYQKLKEKRERRQAARAAQFDALGKQFTAEAVDTSIVDLPTDELIAKLQSRELKAVQVLSAYVWKALEVTRRCNCITEFHPRMMKWAEELDALPQVQGPLHGLPFCVKDDHDLEGMDTTGGGSKFLEIPKGKSSVVVQVLKEAGGIPFCKTNVPAGMFSYGNTNPIYGQTTNAWSSSRAPGGSSSGSGCLVGAGGAPFGTGSDTGGSVRIPSHFNGACGMLPTRFRNSVKGFVQIQTDEGAGIHGQIGILAKNAKLLASVYKVLWQDSIQNQYDAACPPLPWKPETFQSGKKLRIGYYNSIDYFPSIGDTAATVDRAKEALEALGHEVVEFDPPNIELFLKILCNLIMADQFNHGFQFFKDDEITSPVSKFFVGRAGFEDIVEKLEPPKGQTAIDPQPDPDVWKSDVLWNELKRQRQARWDYLDKMKQNNIDAILSPVFPFTSCHKDKCEDFFGAITYTAIWNVVGFPAGVVPFGNESGKSIDAYDDRGDFVLKNCKEDAKGSVGMPIGVQIIGKPYQDELVLRLLNELSPFSKFVGTMQE